MITDVEGSTRLWAADAVGTSASLRMHDEIVRGAIDRHGGYVFATAGDSSCVAFQRASDAAESASVIQRALSDADWPGPSLRVRMGLHMGEAEERGGDYFGPVVNLAARVAAAGHGAHPVVLPPDRVVARFGLHWGATLFMGAITTAARTEVTALGDEANEAARIEACATGGRTLASKQLVERLDDMDAAALDIDLGHLHYTRLADLDTATDKARRDAPAIAVCDV